MKKEYDLTNAQAITLATEVLKCSPLRRRTHRRLVFAALVLACAYSLCIPPIPRGVLPPPGLAVLVAMLIQVAIVGLLLYLVFRVALSLPIRLAVRRIQQQPWEFCGRRTIEVADGEVALWREETSQSFKVAYVDEVMETASGIHLTHGAQVLTSIPKAVCTGEEMRQALRAAHSNHLSQPIARRPGSG